MYRIALACLVLCAAFTVAACHSADERVTQPTSADKVDRIDPPSDDGVAGDRGDAPDFSDKLRAVAVEYKSYTKRGNFPYWAPTMCDAPRRETPTAGIMSESKDSETHGQKLYFLFARDNKAYESAKDQPVGQAFVKESFKPVEVKEQDAMAEKATEGKDGKFYKPGEKYALFIMLKLDKNTRGTHDGWVYGTVEPDGRVTSQGRVKNCMGCHDDAKFDHHRPQGLCCQSG